MPVSATYTGWREDHENDRLAIFYNGMPIAYIDASTFELTAFANLDLTSGANIELDSIGGNQIGTSSGQRLAFFGGTPDSQPSAPTAADGSTVDATYGNEERDVIQNLVTRQAEIISALQDLGLMAS